MKNMFWKNESITRVSLKQFGALSPWFFQKHHFRLFDVFWYFKLWRIHLCYLFLLFRTFYASIFHYKIDSLKEYSLAMDIAMSFTCFKPQYYTRKSSFNPTSSPAPLFAIRGKRKKRPWATSNTWSKFVQIEGIFFQNKLHNTWTATLKTGL